MTVCDINRVDRAFSSNLTLICPVFPGLRRNEARRNRLGRNLRFYPMKLNELRKRQSFGHACLQSERASADSASVPLMQQRYYLIGIVNYGAGARKLSLSVTSPIFVRLGRAVVE